MRISLRRSLHLTAVIAISAALGIGAFTSSANASPTPAGQVKQEYCMTLVAKLQPHQRTSHVISQTCSYKHAEGSILPAGISPASCTYQIWTGYQYTYYTGVHNTYCGNAPCDDAGYVFGNTQQEGWGISSWQAHSSCWETTIYTSYNQGGNGYQYNQGVWEAGVIGSPWDNHVYSVWTRY